MQNSRRPPAEPRRTAGLRERPVSWTRRLEQAREARAKVLAARGAKEGDAPDAHEPAVAEPAGPGPQGPGKVPTPLPEHEGPGRTSSARRATMMWRIAGGIVVGAAVGAVVIWVLLASGQKSQTGDATAPSVASAPPEVVPERPAQDPADEAPPPVEGAAADDEADAATGIAALPEVTAADRARLAARQTAADVDEAAGSDSDDTVTASPPEDVAGTVTEVAARADAEPAPLPSGVPDQDPEGSTDEPPGSTRPSAEAGAGRDAVSGAAQSGSIQVGAARGGVTETARSSGTPDAADADRATTDDTREESVATGAERTSEVAGPEPAPTSDPPRPPEAMQTATPNATGAPVAEAMKVAAADAEDNAAQQETAVAGGGLLYVHAAPGVTSEELAAVAAELSTAGYVIEEMRRVDFRISQTNVRYFHEEDADLSAGVAETLSATSRDFTDYEPSPDPGTIEVWLAG